MATAMEHVQVLVDRIGPRPVSTEEENQAAQYVAQELIDLGLDVDIDEFATPTGTQWPYTVAFIVSIVGIVVSGLAAIFTTMSTTLLVFGLILTAVGWFLYYSEHSGHSLLGRMRTNGISQNVVARYLPESASREKRRRRIVLVAHIDTTRAQLSASPSVVKHVPLLKKIVNWTMPALVLIALLRVLPLPWPPVVNTVLWVIGVIGCLLVLLNAVDIITHRFMPFASGANDNATGLAVMLAAARGLLDPAERARREAKKQETGEGADKDSAAVADAGEAGDAAANGNPFGAAPAMEPMSVHTPEEAYAAGVVPEGATLEYADGTQATGANAALAGADPGQTVVMAGGAQADGAAGAASGGAQADAQVAAEASGQAGEMATQATAPSFAERAARAQARKNAGQASSSAAPKKKSNLPSWYTAGKKKAAKDLAAEGEDAFVDEAAERERVRSRFADVPTADEVEEDDATAQAEQQVAQFVAAAQADEVAGAAAQVSGAEGQPAAAAAPALAQAVDAAAPASAAAEPQAAGAQTADSGEVDAAGKTTQMKLVDADAEQGDAADAAEDAGDAKASDDARPAEDAGVAHDAEEAPAAAAAADESADKDEASAKAEVPTDATQAIDVSSLMDAAQDEAVEEEAIDAAAEEVSPADKTMVISAKTLMGGDDAADEALDDDDDLDISDADEDKGAAAEKAATTADADKAAKKAEEHETPETPAKAGGDDAHENAAAHDEADEDDAERPAAQEKPGADDADAVDDGAAPADGEAPAADEAPAEAESEEADEDAADVAAADDADVDDVDADVDADDSRESLFKGLSSLIPSIGSSSQTGDERQPKGRSARQEMSSKPKRQLRSQADKRKPSRRKVDESFIPTTAPKDDERQAAALSRSRQAAAVDSSYEDTPQGGPVEREDEGFEQSLPPALSGRLPVVGAAADDALGAASRTSFPTLTGSFPAIKVGAESIDESDFARPSDAFGGEHRAASSAGGDDAADDLFAPQNDAADFTIEDSRFHNAVDGVTSIFGRIGKRRKKKNRDDDELFGGGDDGWGNDDEWKGGAYFSDDDLGFDEIAELGGASAPVSNSVGAAAISAAKKRAAEIRESVIQMTVNDTVDKEVWFVALGASAAGNHGMKNFLELHAGELRGALIVNLEGVGAGDVRYLSTEGEGSVHRSDRRLQTLVRQAAQSVLGHEARAQKMEWRDTDATPALVAGMRAITLMGVDEVAPVGWRWTTDTVDIVDEEQLDGVTELVLDVIDNV